MEPLPTAIQGQEKKLLYDSMKDPQGISSLVTTRPYLMPLPVDTSMELQTFSPFVPGRVPFSEHTILGPSTIGSAITWGPQDPLGPHVYPHSTSPIGWPTQHLSPSIHSSQPWQQSQPFMVNSTNNNGIPPFTEQAMSPDQPFEYVSSSFINPATPVLSLQTPDCLSSLNHSKIPHAPVPRYFCKWEHCESLTGFKRLPDILRHIKEIHLAPDAYPCLVDGCGKTFNRAERPRQHQRTHHPRSQHHATGLRF